MKEIRTLKVIIVILLAGMLAGAGTLFAQAQESRPAASAAAKPTEYRVWNGPIPIKVLVQSPAETNTELQIICLFESASGNVLSGSLLETNEKLKGVLDAIRKPEYFRGEFGETLLLVPPPGTLGAKRLLIIGLGDSKSYTPERMELVGSIVFRESNRLGIRHPFFAPTVIDGGVAQFGTGETARSFISGFLRAMRTEKLLKDAGVSQGQAVEELTFLAGPTHASDTRQGLEQAIARGGN